MVRKTLLRFSESLNSVLLVTSMISLLEGKNCRRDPDARSLSFYATQSVLHVRAKLLDELKACGLLVRKNTRLCLHSSPDDPLHEMIIVQFWENFFPPKRHPTKAKSFHVLEGELGVFVFADDGNVIDAARLKPKDSIAYRVGAGLYHADIPLTDYSIHIETTTGPFVGERDRILAPWAPALDDALAREQFRSRMLQMLKSSSSTT